MNTINPLFATDFYKPGHVAQYNPKTEVIFSNMTPRADKLFTHYVENPSKGIIVAGIQGTIFTYVIDLWDQNFFQKPKEKVLKKYKRMMDKGLNTDMDVSHIAALHDLGYLPIEIRSLDEGILCPIQVPVYTVHNTDDRFAWLTNYLETPLSAETWKVMTNATTAFQYNILGTRAAIATCDNLLHLGFQFHDFSARGLSGIADAYHNGMAHLTSFIGTDNISAIDYIEDFYAGLATFVGASIPASEHSVATTNICKIIDEMQESLSKEEWEKLSIDDLRYAAEKEFLRRFIMEIYPDASHVSYVADSYDYWSVITKILVELKDEIMSRVGKLVLRPDSGDPVKVVAGYRHSGIVYESALKSGGYVEYGMEVININGVFYKLEGISQEGTEWESISIDLNTTFTEAEVKGSIEVLWEIFGGNVNSKGYKELDSHIGLIYGDSITVERATEIFKRLKAKGFAANNIVFGVGSYTYNYNTRDTFGFACKATGSIIDGKEILVSKDPKTDVKKRSAKGFLKVIKDDSGDLKLVDGLSFADIDTEDNQLKVRFRNGVMYNETTIEQIRENVAKEVQKAL